MACFSTLAAELSLSGLDLGSLPAGYRLATVLFNWENECQREGWNAFAWTPDIDSVAQAYVEVGLGDEAAAISRAAAAWRIDKDNLDGINAAYDDGPNVHTIDDDRFEYLVDYLCERATQLFSEE